jgi:hypothetical protein
VKVGRVSGLAAELAEDGDPDTSEAVLDIKLQLLGRRDSPSSEKHAENVERTEFFR